MVYTFDLETLPQIKNTYTVTRNTVWQVADPYHILIAVLDGRCEISTAGETYTLGTGSCIFIPAEQSYTRRPLDGEMCTMMYVHFTVSGETSELGNSDAAQLLHGIQNRIESALLDTRSIFTVTQRKVFLFPVIHTEDSTLTDICGKIQELRLGYRIDSSLFLAVYFCEMLAHLSKRTVRMLKEIDPDTEIVKLPYTLKKAVWYIKQNHTKRIKLSDLCRHCNISQSQLTRYFKQTFGTTPTQYITEFKINRAREILMTSPELSVKNVCGSLGFDDQHYFSRIFFKVTGETPTEYRYRVTNYSKRQNTAE